MIFNFIKRFLPHVYVNVGDKTDTVAATFEEGGEWNEFPLPRCQKRKNWRVHSILFKDGSVWDAQNGWRADCWRVDRTAIKRRNGDYWWWSVGTGWIHRNGGGLNR